MSDMKWLKRADHKQIANAVKAYGSVALIGSGFTEIEMAEIAARSISGLSARNQSLETLFISTLSSDGSYESITFRIDDFNPEMSMVALEKVITYKKFEPLEQREEKVERGPILLRKHAEAIVALLNSLDWSDSRS